MLKTQLREGEKRHLLRRLNAEMHELCRTNSEVRFHGSLLFPKPLINTCAPSSLSARGGAKCRSESQGNNMPIRCVKAGFLCLGHSNWTICSLLSQFCFVNFQKKFTSQANSY